MSVGGRAGAQRDLRRVPSRAALPARGLPCVRDPEDEQHATTGCAQACHPTRGRCREVSEILREYSTAVNIPHLYITCYGTLCYEIGAS